MAGLEADDLAACDFSDLLALSDAAFPSAKYVPIAADPLNNELFADWQLPAAGIGSEPDYSKFEDWIPQFVRPAKPCENCRVKRIYCYITRGMIDCTPCSSLFRDCSLANPSAPETMNQSLADLSESLNTPEGSTSLAQPQIPLLTPYDGVGLPQLDDAPGSFKRNGIRFPRQAVKILRDWLVAHQDDPYPTEDEKADLERETGLKPTQIANWLANARRRRKAIDRVRPRSCSSPSLKPSTAAIDIPQPEKPWDELNPFERWKHSPPENEPASMRDIANAVANSDLAEDPASASPSTTGRPKTLSRRQSPVSNVRAPSTGSQDTAPSSFASASNSAVYSHHSSQSRGSFGSFNSSLAGKRDRRRRRWPAPATLSSKPADGKKRIFQCTFCTDSFKSKYDWTRHEKSLHLSLEKWSCAPSGPVVTDPITGNKRCVFCDELNPTETHIESHNYRECEEKGLDARTFYRKDHLRQHIRSMHNCEMTSFMGGWKSTAININCRCGFCAKRFTNWQERVDHLTAHFKAGARMTQWTGCRGLDPAVAAQVTNAMPPFLIGMESVSPNPFSASDRRTWRENPLDAPDANSTGQEAGTNTPVQERISPSLTSQIGERGSKVTCWEILTVYLGKYANEMAKKGVILTDEMLQVQARKILYDSEDSWNQTAADNPEWLDLFKKAHGLDFIPSQIGGSGTQVPEDIETYSDLGLRVPFTVQLQTYNREADPGPCACNTVGVPHASQANLQHTSSRCRALFQALEAEGVLRAANKRCNHGECDANFIQIVTLDGEGATKYRWCNYDLPPAKAQEVANLQTMRFEDQKTKAETQTSTPHDSVNGGADHSFLRRHRYEMPQDRAGRFETITGAWQDSGMMPDALKTTANDGNEWMDHDVMALLGNGTLRSYPSVFNTAADPTFTMSSDGIGHMTLPTTTAAREAAMIADIDRLIAKSSTATADQRQMSPTADLFPFTAAEAELPMDLTMGEFDLDDVDMNFDGVFDMTVDEAFGGI